MIRIDPTLTPADLAEPIERLWRLSAGKIRSIQQSCPPEAPAPVFTVRGQYTARGWTEWTRGFQYGSAILHFDATGQSEFLRLGLEGAERVMPRHVTHFGVHDHGFQIVSTFGNLHRLMREGRGGLEPARRPFYELALRASGAVQARRWTQTIDGGFIHSFNGPHSLFIDTLRTLRVLALAHELGQKLLEENDAETSLLDRLCQHAGLTARYSVYYGQGRDAYDVPGRVAHESLFNVADGRYRCPATQQGYSPRSTWTRGLAWAMLGFAELLEWLQTRSEDELAPYDGRAKVVEPLLAAGRAVCDFYLANTPTDGVPYWDTGAPGLAKLGNYLDRPAEPFNEHEPVDSSAAVIAAQGLLRLGRHVGALGQAEVGKSYWQAGLTVARTVLAEPYLSTDPDHQGLILHSVYHRPNGWDFVPPDRSIPCGESSLWGDYHARELALYLQRIIRKETYYTFFGPAE